jgi:two-component system cell cycle response regulator
VVRLTRKVFNDLTIWMVGLGLFMGVAFPFFAVIMGVPSEQVLTPWFFAACMTAGFIVGGTNIWLARKVIGSRLHILADRMRAVETNLKENSRSGAPWTCTPDTCSITVDSEDEIGESGKAFNYLIESLEVSHRTDTAVHSFTEMLTSHLEIDTLTDQALQQLLQHTDASAGAILIATEGEMKVAASQGIRASEDVLTSDHVRRALQSEKQVIVTLPENVVLEGVLVDFRPREVIIDPVLYKGVPLGVIILASTGNFTDEVRARLTLFRQGMALAFNNALTHDRLQRLAALDPLTGIYNRRFGMARLREEFSRAVRAATPLGVMMFDIDHFKKVNDTYGHLAGDRVLTQVAKTARAALREGDILMRYGGEEFLVILPTASKENARAISERLRHMLEETSVADGDQVIRVTISVGVTSYPEFDVAGEQDLVKRADEALYSAKESGRNRVVVGTS